MMASFGDAIGISVPSPNWEGFSDERRDAWKATIDSYQNHDGFYDTGDDAPGTQPYHGAGEALPRLASVDLTGNTQGGF